MGPSSSPSLDFGGWLTLSGGNTPGYMSATVVVVGSVVVAGVVVVNVVVVVGVVVVVVVVDVVLGRSSLNSSLKMCLFTQV